MNSQHSTLMAAKAKAKQEKASFAAADAESRRTQAVAAECAKAAEIANAAIDANDDIDAAEALAEAARVAEARATAARNAARKAADARALAQAAWRAATEAVSRIAVGIVHSEVDELAAEIDQLLSAAFEKGQRLAGAVADWFTSPIGGPTAQRLVTPKAEGVLSRLQRPLCEPGDLARSANVARGEPQGVREGREHWNGRLAELLRDETTEPAPPAAEVIAA